jgi:plasmid stabilization system protein ParE
MAESAHLPRLIEVIRAGHVREDLTADSLKFWSVFSYLIVYDPNTRPIQIMRVIHGSREVSAIFGQDDD